MRRRFFLLIIVLLFSLQGYAQEKIESERADQGEDAHALKRKEFQLESGIIFNNFDTGANGLIGEVMLRYGLAKHFEIRAMLEDGKQRDRFVSETTQGFYPLAIGAKAVLLEKHKTLPDIALSGYLKLPFTLRSKEQSVYWSPALVAVFEKELENKQWDFLGNIGLQQEAYSKEYQWQGAAIIKYEGIDKLNIIAEYFATYQDGEQPLHNIGAGVAYQVKDNFEIDLSAGTTIFSDEPNQFVSLGFAVRLPH